MLIFYIDFDLIFGIPNKEINVEVNIKDNQVPKASKHSDDSTIINGKLDECVTSTPNAHIVEDRTSIPVLVKGEQLQTQHQVEGIN